METCPTCGCQIKAFNDEPPYASTGNPEKHRLWHERGNQPAEPESKSNSDEAASRIFRGTATIIKSA